MGTVNELLTIARGELGNTENPAGSNRTKYGKWFGLDGNPWCMMFVMWCFDRAGTALPRRTASCGELMRAAQAAGMDRAAAGSWVTSGFRPGDVVIYDFSGKQKTTQHCGIVERILPDYGVQAIEGNTSPDRALAASSGHARSNSARPLDVAVAESLGSQDNGGQVCRKSRARKVIIGAVRPRFDTEEKEENMTGKEIYDALQDYLASQPVPAWAREELDRAVRLGVTDGKNAMELIPRYQAAIMALRAAEKR